MLNTALPSQIQFVQTKGKEIDALAAIVGMPLFPRNNGREMLMYIAAPVSFLWCEHLLLVYCQGLLIISVWRMPN